MIELGSKVRLLDGGSISTVVAREEWLFGEPRYGVSGDEFDGKQISVYWFKESQLMKVVEMEPKKKAPETEIRVSYEGGILQGWG